MSESRKLPVLPLRGLIIFPMTVINIDVGREKSLAATEAAIEKDSTIFIVSQKDASVDVPTPDDVFTVGTIAEVKQLIRLPGGTLRVLVEGVTRARIDEIAEKDPYFVAHVSELEEAVPEPSAETTALLRTTVDAFVKLADVSKHFPPETIASIADIAEPDRLADIVASHLTVAVEEKQRLLEAVDVKERLEALCALMYKEADILEIERGLQQKVRSKMEKTQKEYYLREQMKAIQVELGQKDQRVEEIESYRRKLKGLHISDEAREKISKEIDRLSRIPAGAAEGAVVDNYINWCLSLPWDRETDDREDLRKAEEILEEDHYGLKDVKERIVEYLAVKQLTHEMKGPILCLVGPPGVGKTSLAKSVARALDRKFVKASLGGVRDEAEIRGHRRTYVGAMPGRIMQCLKQADAKNPVFLLDEIDKMSMDFRGDPSAALLEALDPEQNHAFVDHYIELSFDLSQVLFLTTANAAYRIPRPLLDRMETIYISSYTEEEKLEIARTHLLPKQLKNHGLSEEQLAISENALRRIINEYTLEAGVRNLERSLATVCRKVARKIAQNRSKRMRVTRQNVNTYLGIPKFRHNLAEREDQIGLATGLAWTEVGGVTMPVEVTLAPGQGKLTLTGQLGDVMKESAQAAVTYVRSRSEELGVDSSHFSETDIHIHIPQGAIPKDGPSAGITLATALVSAITKRAVKGGIGMTGEITLRGRVLPIGGLKEKVLAGHRAGLNTIVLPKDNERDLSEIPENIRRRLKFALVDNVDEVLEVSLVGGRDED